MTADVAVLKNFGSDHWNAEIYGSLSVASTIASLVKNRTQTVRLAYFLHKLNTRLKSFFNDLHEAIEHPPATTEPVTPEAFQKAITTVKELSIQLCSIYEGSKRARLTNNSFLAGSLSRLHTYSEDLSELAEWLEMLRSPESIEAVFDRAKKEQEQGDVFDLSQVDL